MKGVVSSKLKTMTSTTFPTLVLVTTRASTISWEVVSTLRGVFKRLLLSGVRDKMRTDASHFRDTNFFQSEHGMGLIEGKNRITLANQGSNNVVGF